jgi:hypothetical protein
MIGLRLPIAWDMVQQPQSEYGGNFKDCLFLESKLAKDLDCHCCLDMNH